MRYTRLARKIAMCAGFCLLALSANAQRNGGGGGGGGQGQQAPPPLMVMPLSGGAYWTTGGAGANTGFIVGTNGVIVIDAKMTANSAQEMLADIAKVTPKPVTHVILTHSDPDHVNGLAGFPKGLTIIAQENCKQEMEDAVNAPNAAPAMVALRDYLPYANRRQDAGHDDRWNPSAAPVFRAGTHQRRLGGVSAAAEDCVCGRYFDDAGTVSSRAPGEARQRRRRGYKSEGHRRSGCHYLCPGPRRLCS